MATATATLDHRRIAVLKAVLAGRCELSGGSEPDIYVDGLCCCDHSVAGDLLRDGMVRPVLTVAGRHARAQITERGRTMLATHDQAMRPAPDAA